MSAERANPQGELVTSPEAGEPAPTVPASAATEVTPVTGRRFRRLLGVPRRHLPFCVVLVLAVAVRLVAMLGYPPAKFFSDSFSYLGDAVTGQPDPVRGNGYAFFLRVLMPLHSFSVVTGIQALMGLVMGVLIYAVLRRRGLAWWGAAL
ncbi:MAG TPA: hypothetical protein VGG75_14565, partial [Trebonia sp.]